MAALGCRACTSRSACSRSSRPGGRDRRRTPAGCSARYGADAGPERVTVLAGPGDGAGTARPAVDIVTMPDAPGPRYRGPRAAGLARGLLAPAGVGAPRGRRGRRGPLPAHRPDPAHADADGGDAARRAAPRRPAAFSRAERVYRRIAYDRAARQATRVVTDSEHSRARIVARAGIPAERVVAIRSASTTRASRRTATRGARRADAARAPWLLYPASAVAAQEPRAAAGGARPRPAASSSC